MSAHRGESPHFAIAGCIGEHNAGDEALFVSTVQQIRARWPNARITAFSNDIVHTQGTYGVEAVTSLGLLWPSTLIYGLRRHLIWPALRTLWSCDWVVVCGGELVRTDFGLKATLSVFDRLVLARLLRKRRLLVGVGAGKLLDAMQVSLMRFACAESPMVLREYESFKRVQEKGIGVPMLGSDMALHLDTPPRVVRFVEDRWCAVVLRDPVRTRSGRSMKISREEFVIGLADSLDRIAESTGLKLVFLPFGLVEDDDRAFQREVRERMRSGEEVSLVECEYSVEELLSIVGEASLVVAMRLHGGIFAMNRTVPVVGLSYDAKVRKQFEHFGMGDRVLDLEHVDKLADLARSTYSDRDVISGRLRAQLKDLRTEFERTLDIALGYSR